MKAKRLILILMVVCSGIFLCGKSSDFLIVSASKQNFQGGQPGASGKITYSFTFVAKKPSSKITIDELWVKNKKLKLERVIFMGGGSAEQFAKNDTIRFIAVEEILPLTAKLTGKDKTEEIEKAPIEFNGEALIGYTAGSKRKYKVIDKFNELKTVNAP